MDKTSLLTEDEAVVLELLAEAFNFFVKLPQLHPADKPEFMKVIHEAQNIVMSRPVASEIAGYTSEQDSQTIMRFNWHEAEHHRRRSIELSLDGGESWGEIDLETSKLWTKQVDKIVHSTDKGEQ